MPKTLMKAFGIKARDIARTAVAVIVAAALLVPPFPLSQLTPAFGDTGETSSPSYESIPQENTLNIAALHPGQIYAELPLDGSTIDVQGNVTGGSDDLSSTETADLFGVPKTEEEKQAILDGYLADGAITEEDLSNEFLVKSLTGEYMESDQADLVAKCANEQDGFEDAMRKDEERQAEAESQAAEAVAQSRVFTEEEVEVAQKEAKEAEEAAIVHDPTLTSEEALIRQPGMVGPIFYGDGAASSNASANVAPRARSLSRTQDGQAQSDTYSTDVVLKDIKSVIMYNNYGTPQTQDVSVDYINNYLERHTAYVQMLNMPSFYSPVLSAALRDGCIYITLQLPVGAGEEPKTFEVLYSKGADWQGYVKVISGQPTSNDTTMMANIASTPGYDASRDQAYRNAYKLAPYASYEDIVKSGNAIPTTSGLYRKTIQELWPVHVDQGMKVSMFEGEEEGIVRNVVCFSDGTSETTDVHFLGTSSLTATYTMGETGILYQPDFWTLGESAQHGIDRMAAFIQSKTYDDYFKPLNSSVKMHRTVRDYFDRNIHKKAKEVAANLLTNIPTWNPVCSDSELWNFYMRTAENATPTNDWHSTAVELKMFNLLFLYNYWDRFLNFGIGGSDETGYQNNANAFLIVAFRGGVIKPGLSLVNMTYDVRSDSMLSYSMVRLLSNTVIYNRLGPFTGIRDATTLIKTIVLRTSDYKDVADWFADYMSTIAFYHEYKPPVITGHPETEKLYWRGWDQASRRFPDYLPIWLTMEPGAMYMGSTSMSLSCGSSYIYFSKVDLSDDYQKYFKARLDGILKPCSLYASTTATIVGKERVDTTIVLALDNMTSRYDYGSAQNVYYESHGLWGKKYTEDPWQKNFFDVSELYDTTGGQGAAAATYSSSPTSKRILFLAYSALSCGWAYYWSHEMAHALDNDVFLGAGRRDGASNEDFTDGLLTQGHGALTPVINLCYDYGIENDRMSNYTRDRIYGKDQVNDFYGKVYEALDALDYAALQAFLRLDKDEQNAVASQVWFSGQNGTSPLDSGTNTTVLCSRSKVLNGYDGTTATMPVNASVFNDGTKKFETIEEVYDNQLFLRGGIPDGGSITWQRQIYVSEDNRGSWWFPVHANTFYPDSRSFKVMMYRMLGREGYDAFATYGSAGGNDLQKLKQITGCSSYKEWQMKTWSGIEAKKDNLVYADFDDLVDKFEVALKSDASMHDRNLGSMSALRMRMFYLMKRITNDFRYGIYENQKPITYIRTLDDLLAIANDPQGNYVLANDIDASSVGFEEGKALIECAFYGKFDGKGHKIYANGHPLPYLFTSMRHAYVKDLALEGVIVDMVSSDIANCELENISYVRFERDIHSVDDFVGISNDLRMGVKTFHLKADLDFTQWSAANAAAETPQASIVVQPLIGTLDSPKVFDGGGHKITGLSGVSLFSRMCYAEVSGLTIEKSTNYQSLESANHVSLITPRAYLCKFSDLFFDNVQLRGKSWIGFVCGDDGFADIAGKDARDGGSQFNRIQVTNAVLQTGSATAVNPCYGGFVSGRLCLSSLEDIYAQGTLVTYGVSCGGVAGAITKSAKLNRCISNVGISCPKSPQNGVIVGHIEPGADVGNTKISNCFGLGNPALAEKSTPEQTRAAAGARIAVLGTSEAVSVFENCYESAAQQYGSSLAVNEDADVAFARTDLKTPAQYTFPDSFQEPYSIVNLRNNKKLFNDLGFTDGAWEFDPTIPVGYPMLRFVGNKDTFYDYDLDFRVDYKNEKLLFGGSSFDRTKVSVHNLPYRTPYDIPMLGLKAGDWRDLSFVSTPERFSNVTLDTDSIDLSEIIEYEKFKNDETAYKGTRSVSLYYDIRASMKPYSFEKTIEISPRPEMDCADRVKGVRANSKHIGAIHFASMGIYDASELEYRPVAASMASGEAAEEAASEGATSGSDGIAAVPDAQAADNSWIPVASAMTPVAPGAYEVRIAATDHSFASYPITVTVDDFDPDADAFPMVLETNGGAWSEGHEPPSEYSSENGYTLPGADMLTRNGYTFQGWYTSPDFSGAPVTSIPSGSQEPVALYAKWSANTYSIDLNLNGGSLADPSANVTHYVAGIGAELPVPSRSYRTFAGWFDNEACEGEPVELVSRSDWGDKQFWAKWDAVTYVVALRLQGAALPEGMSNEFVYEAGEETALPNGDDMTYVGHVFKGWFDNKECMGTPIFALSKDDVGNKELWAKWAAEVYDVALVMNGGKLLVGETDLTSYQYGIEAVLPGMERAGYEFGGWYDNAALAGLPVESILTGEMGNKTFWAKWNPLTYAIAYDLGRDEAGDQPPEIDLSSFESYTVGQGTALPDSSVMVWEDHVFAGWYEDAGYSGSAVTNVSPEAYGDLTLYARWVGNACVLSYHVNGGNFNSTPQSVYSFDGGAYHEGSEIVLTDASGAYDISRSGYAFDGWYADAACSGAPVESVQLVRGVIDLYAKWTLQQYGIEFELNDGDFVDGFVPPASYNVESGGIGLPSSSDVFRDGFVFKGWCEDPSLQGATVTAIQPGSIGDKTFYAKWEEEQVTPPGPDEPDPDKPDVPDPGPGPDNPDPDNPDVPDPPEMVIRSLAFGTNAQQTITWTETDEGHLYARIEMPREQMPTKAEDFKLEVPDGILYKVERRTKSFIHPLAAHMFAARDVQDVDHSDLWDITLTDADNPARSKRYTLEVVPVDKDPVEPIDPVDPSDPSEPSGPSDPTQPPSDPNDPGQGDPGDGGGGDNGGTGSNDIADPASRNDVHVKSDRELAATGDQLAFLLLFLGGTCCLSALALYVSRRQRG